MKNLPFDEIDCSQLLKDHVVIRTKQIEEFHAYLAGLAGQMKRKINGDSSIMLELRHVRLDQTEMMMYSGNTDVTVETVRSPSSAYWIQFPLTGHFLVEFPNQNIHVWPGHGLVFSPTQHLRRTSRPGSTLAFIIPAPLIYSRAESRTGSPINECLIFEPSIEPSKTQKLLSLMILIAESIDRGRIRTGDMLGKVVENAFVDLLLEIQPLQEGPRLGRSDAELRLNRVIEVFHYVDSNLDREIKVEELAEIAECSVRELQNTFSKLCRINILGAIRQRRLVAARRLLESRTNGITVGSVAVACGYVHQGRFASDYRNAYGESPSDTLSGNQGTFS
ncbi:MAG: hypothetical protein RJA81_1012 [Planctomycetota bacterium]